MGLRFMPSIVPCFAISLVLISSSARAEEWDFTINGGGTFSAQDTSRSSSADDINGTWTTLANGFMEFTRSGGDGPNIASKFYALELVNHFLVIPPVFTGDTKISALVSGNASCPPAGKIYDYNFAFAKWNANDVSVDSQGGFGGMRWDTTSDNAKLELTSLYRMTDPSQPVDWWTTNYNFPVTNCNDSGSVPVATATGAAGSDQDGTLYLGAQGMIYKPVTGRLAYGLRRMAFPGTASLTGDYACLLLRDDTSGNNADRTKYIDVTFNAEGVSGTGYTKDDVATDSNDTGYGQVVATLSSVNSPLDGMARGTIQRGAGTPRNLGCIGTLNNKVVLFCSAQEFDTPSMPMNLLCFSDSNRSGRLDHHFDEVGGYAGDGVVFTDTTGALGNNDAHAKWIGQQSDGKYVVVGYADRNFDATKYAMAVARYNEDGSLDTDFAKNLADANDSDGWRRIVNSTANSLDFERGNWGQIDSSGNIYVFGKGKLNNVVNAIATRLTSTGAIDTSWGSSGMFATTLGSANNLNAEQFIVDSSNRTVYCGNRKAGSTTRQDYAIWRATSGGSLDTGNFGTSSGYTAITIGAGTSGSYVDKCFTIKEQTVGSTTYYVTGGYEEQTSATDADSALVRFNEDGTQDTTAFTTYGGDLGGFGVNDFIYGLDIDADNKIITVGFAASPSTSDTTLLIARWNEDGTPDNTFTGSTNYRAHDLSSGEEKGFSVTVDPNTGKYYVFGQFGGGTENDNMAVYRFNTDGTLDTDFGPGGLGYQHVDDGSNGDDEAWHGILDNRRRLIATGNSSTNGFMTIRLFP